MHHDTRKVITDLLRKIAADEYAPGEPIPTVVQLAEEHGVSLSTADDARSQLIAAGVLMLQPGVGPVVAPPVSEDGAEAAELAAAIAKLDKDIAFLRDALENPNTSVRWNPNTGRG